MRRSCALVLSASSVETNPTTTLNNNKPDGE